MAVGFVAVALFIAAQRRPEEKSYAIQHEAYESTGAAEVEERTDASEGEGEASEEDEAEDDAGEAPSKSIYDLQPDDE